MNSPYIDCFFSPPESRHEESDSFGTRFGYRKLPTTIKPVLKIFPEVKVLNTETLQEFWVAIEVEGVLHNQQTLTNQGLDIIIIIDNG